MIGIPGAQVIEVIHEGLATSIHRGTQRLDKQRLIEQAMKSDNPTGILSDRTSSTKGDR